MIKSVTIINYLGETLKIELARPEESGFAITEITGLGPAKATVNTTELSTNDGTIFNSARLNSRNIVIAITFLPNPTIEDSRHLSYKYFPVKKYLTFIVETDQRICETIGYVEANEPDIFSEQESAHISIICPDPNWYSSGDGGTNVTAFYGIEPAFEFPFPGEDLDDSELNEPNLEFGDVINSPSRSVFYEGDAEVGIVITIHAVGTASNIAIYNRGTQESMTIDTAKLEILTGSGIINGDDIIISTLRGEKTVTLLRSGVRTNILNCLNRNADWFQLSKGDNVFTYTAEDGAENLQFRIENRIVYEGI